MKNFLLPLRYLVALFMLTLSACTLVEMTDTTVTPTKMSLEEELEEEERAAEFIATARAEKTQAASRVSPYVEVSNEEQTFLAFWFPWNDEHILLPINEVNSSDLGLISCQLDSSVEISSGALISGVIVSQNDCELDKHALENARPIIKINGHIDIEIKTETVNVIDLGGEYAENLADTVTFTIENDLLGSGDLMLSLYRTDGPNGSYRDNPSIPAYTLSENAFRASFEKETVADLEYVDDAIYQLKRRFSWEIPSGYEELNLAAGDENWFVIIISESGRETEAAYIQIKGVGATKKE